MFQENFEPPSNADLVTANGAIYNFSINSRLAHSGLQCDTAMVTSNDTAYLTTNSFSTVGYPFVFLNFSHICKIQVADAAEVQVSIDNGATWTTLTGTQYVNPGNSNFVPSGNKFNSNTYPTDWLPASDIAQPTNAWWKNEAFNLSALVGNQANVKVRFVLRDANGNGAFFNHGWYIDDIVVTGSVSEITPPTVLMKPPVLQDTTYSTGPFDIYTWIKDASGIDTAYLVYQVNAGIDHFVPMLWVSDSTYKGTIPSYTYTNRITYYVHAIDNSVSHNSANSTNQWFYIKKLPNMVQIGTGVTFSPNYGPIYRTSAASSFDYSKYFYVVTAAELSAAGLPLNAPISKIEWYKTDAFVTTGNAIFNIWMKNSVSTGYAAPTSWATLTTGATQVFNSTTVTVPATIGWLPFNLTPYTYAGGALEIGTDWNISGVVGNPTTGAFNWQYSTGYPTNYTLGTSSATPIVANLSNVTYGGTSRPNMKIYYGQVYGHNDAGVTQITSPTGIQMGGSNLSVNIVIKNFGTDSLKKTTIQWKVDGVLQTPYPWIGAMAEAVTSPSFLIGTINVSTGNHTIKAWTTIPNDNTDENNLNDTTTITFFACTAPLSGTYTVGGGGANYATFADVMTALNNCGVNGPTVFKINSGTYDEQLTLNAITGASAINTITFVPNTGATVVITNNSATSTIKLNGSDYIIFNGSNNGTSSRNLTIANTSTATSTAAIWMASMGASLGCEGNVIKNCNINCGANTTGIYGIAIGGTTIAAAGADNDNNTIQNNSITKAYVGIWAQGSSATNPGLMDNLQIIGNSVGSNTVSEYIGHDGIMLSNGISCNIQRNTIFNILTTNTTPVGLTLSTGIISTNVTKNNINNIAYTGTSGYGGRGLYVNTGSAASNLLIANNIIYGIGGDGYTSFSISSPVGMYFDGITGGLRIYYNSVYLRGTMTYSAATITTAVLFNTTTITGITMKNNVFQNSLNNTASTTAKNYAIYSTAAYTSFTSLNNNDYFVSGTQGILGYLGSDKTTLAAWKTASAHDTNSVNVNPSFITLNDLHTYSSGLNNHALPIAGITDDYSGTLRSLTTPDIGAYEFDIPAKNLGITAIINPVNSCALTATENIIIRLKNWGAAPLDSADVYYRINNGTLVHELMVHTIAPDSSYNYTFATQANLIVPGTYNFLAYIHANGDTIRLNDTINNYSIYSGYNFNLSAYTQSFEPTDYFGDWTTVDANADGYGWTVPYTGGAHTGTNSARLYNGGVNDGNDWLFTRCFALNAGSSYKIDFWYEAQSALYPQSIDLKVGSTNTPAAMTTTLLSLPSFINTTYQKASVTFTPPTSGSYTFGWYGYSLINYYYAYIDDINISIVPPQEATLLSIESPLSGCGLSNAEPVSVKIKNTGSATINGNLTAYYKFNNGATVSEAVPNLILPNDTLTFTFTQTVNPSVILTDAVFPLKTWLTLTGDPFLFNDTINGSVGSSHVPANPVTISDTVAYSTPATLQAISPDSIYWYSNPSGGTSVGAGHVFVTPNLYTQTLYYAEAMTPGGTTTWNFTSGLEGWTPSSPCSSPVTWSWASDGGVGAAFAVDYATNTSQVLTSPLIQVNGASTMNLSYNHRYATEAGYDHGFVAYRLNGGTWVQFMPSVGIYNTSDGEYNEPLWNNCATSPNMPLYDGTMTYANHSGAINTSGASTLEVAFVFTTDGSGAVDGWYLNNVTLDGGLGGCASARIVDTAYIELLPWEASVISMPSPVDQCSNGTENVTVKIRNNGFNTINGGLLAKYTVNGSASVSEPIANTILPGDTLTYTFATPIIAGLTTSNQDSIYNIKAYIELTGDVFPVNDTLLKSVTLKYIPPVPGVANLTIPYGTSGIVHATAVDSVSWYNTLTGGTSIFNGSSYTTPILYGMAVYYAEARAGAPVVKLTEITHYSTGTGYTNPYPAYVTGADLIEISNLGSAIINLQNYKMNIYGVGARTFTLPSVNLDAGQVMVLCAGTGTDSPADRYYNMGGGNDIIQSSSLVGFALKDPSGAVVDAVADNGYTFDAADSVAAIEWTGSITGISGFAGIIRNVSDNNDASDWAIASVVAPQTIGTLNPTLTGGSSGSGCASARVADTVFVSGTPPCDMTVQAIHTPNTGVELTNHELVSVRVKNFGTSPAIKVPIHYTINGGTPVNDTIQGPIASHDTAQFTFATVADLSTFGTYALAVYTDLACDATLVNDTVHKTVVCNPMVYCTSIPTYTSDEEIFSVTVNGSTNAYDCLTVAPGPGSILNRYSNFMTLPPLSSLSQGATISFTILEDECDGATYYANGCAIWIDLNRDGDFTDTGEKVFGENVTTMGPRTITGTFTVPIGSFSGITAMRIIVAESNSGTALQPCMTYGYGETEDYNIRILPQIPLDAGATAFVEPLNLEDEGASVPVKVIIKNYGLDTITNAMNMAVKYSYNGGPVQSIIWNGGNIPSLATDTAVLPNLTVLPFDHSLCAWTVLAGDSNTFNDTTCMTITGTPLYDMGVTTFLQPGTQLIQGTNATVRVVFINFGADTVHACNLVYKVNGVIQATQPWTGSLAPYFTDTLTFTQTFVVPSAMFSLCAYTSMASDESHGNDTLCMNPYGVFTSPLPYYDNFDSPIVNWSEQDNGAGTVWQLGTPNYGVTNSTYSAPNAWDLNLTTAYTSSASAMLYTQNFDFSHATSARLKFWINGYIESSYEGVRIDYTIDTGATWQVLGTMGDPLATNWYNDATISSSGTPNKPGWTGASNGWLECQYKLNILDSVPIVRFRFVFTSDPSFNYDGFSVDDFSITVPSLYDAGVDLIKTPTVQAPAASSQTVKVRLHNYGIDTLTSIPVSYAINMGLPTTETWTGTLAPDDTISYTFTAMLTVPTGSFSLCSFTGLALDGDHLNDTTCVTIMGVPTFLVPYADDFEGPIYFFGTGTSNLWEWGAPTATTINAAYSPTHAWATNLDGYYVDNAIDYLYSPMFDLTQVDSAYLEFYHWYNTQASYDGCRIEYSADGGAWTVLGVSYDPNALNWYNSTYAGIPCWSGNSGGYVHSKFRLTTIPEIMNATGTVQFRYKFFSDASNSNFDGWAIDNFAVSVPAIPKDAGVTAILQPAAATQTGTQVTVQVTIKNFGTDSLYSVPVRYRVNLGTVTAETWTGFLVPGATANYTFTTTFASPGTTYNLCAFTRLTGDTYWWNDTTCTSVNTTPGAKDLGVSKLLSPSLTTVFGHADTVKVRIKNYGFSTETSVPVIYQRNFVTVGSGTWTGTLVPGDSVDYTFATLDVSPLGSYSLCAKTVLSGDVNTANDEVCVSITGLAGIETYNYDAFELMQNVPNPSNNATDIVYYVPNAGKIHFEMMDILGQMVKTEEQDARRGKNQIDLDVSAIPEGIYFYSVEFNGEKLTKRMAITK